MEWWKLSLNFVTSIAWPLVVALAVVLLRRSLSKLLEEGVELDILGAKMKSLGRAEKDAGEALADAEQAVSMSQENQPLDLKNPEDRPVATDGGDQLHDRVAMLESKLLEVGRQEEKRRGALERVLEEGARLGWEWARSGEDEPPTLQVDWSPDGSPRVSTFREPRQPSRFRQTSSSFNGAAYVKRLSRALQSIIDDSGTRIEENALLADLGKEADVAINLPNGKRVILEAKYYRNSLGPEAVAQLGRLIFSPEVAGAIIVSTTALTPSALRALRLMEEEANMPIVHVQWKGPEDNDKLSVSVFHVMRLIGNGDGS
ncbi:restriction endonuclease [Nonomuraea sp. NEAU-A123]|uniref:restriction endonuclease n=1 Tax=Nonomuraea sp. NEAU-A123 TaxID=2839649 RepID=UPI001BE49601|nr:restriction endonuclease [Nonomuraea sp. NEAU-A123]MBT2228360.1 restriction endonuclease [Nonomuraea sp. NEAU-A123]